ncbi:hypothetical protein MPSEU_001068900 [Mayamaea pseudoterrestris]|nr:hypothetical protein MPSEU_001068900 [Mayamaea pseudoterrestris]
MESPWAQASGTDAHFGTSELDDLKLRRGSQTTARPTTRSSLGMLIERSTSAPPSQSGLDKYSFDAFRGNNNDIFDQGSTSPPGMTTASNSAYSSSSHSGDLDISNFLNGASSQDVDSTSHLIDHFTTFSPFAASRPYGRSASAGLQHSGASSFHEDEQFCSSDSNKLFNSSPINSKVGLVRSQSAAPTLHGSSNLGPPPGLSLSTSQFDSFLQHHHHQMQQRPASAGSVLKSSALRAPSAKTLMDLIQEEIPTTNESFSHDQDDQHLQRPLSGGGRSSASPGRSESSAGYSPTPVTSNQHQRHQIEHSNPSMATYQNQQGQVSSRDAYQHKQMQYPLQQRQDSPPQLQHLQSPSYSDHGRMPSTHVSPQQHFQAPMYSDSRMDQKHHAQMPQQQSNNVSPYQHLQSPMYDSQGRLLMQQQAPHAPMYQQQQCHQLQQQVYVPHQNHLPYSQQRPPRTFEGGQAQQGMFVLGNGNDYQQPPPQLRGNMHASDSNHAPQFQQQHGQQVITMASGQTVFISGTSRIPSASNQQSNNGYAPTRAAYQQEGQQPSRQLAHIVQSVVNNNDQYVSVVPISNGAYWPAEHNNMGGVAILNGQPVAIQSVGSGGGHGNVGQQQHYQSRQSSLRETKQGGRGSAGRSGRGGRRADAGKAHPTGSAMLNEFRATKNRDWSMHQIAGYVVEFCQDQNGSRFIQQRLESKVLEEQQIVVHEVLPAIRRLRDDVFGNYVIQKLLDFGTTDTKAAIRDTLKGEMVQLSFQMYGCRVVQKAFEGLADEDLPGLLGEFQYNVLSCIHDQNGNHVIQKCIEVMSARLKRRKANSPLTDEHLDFIIRDILVNASSLSCHPYGCRVLQRILEHCDEGRKKLILDEVMKSHRKLLDDQYGNYVIQHVLQFGREVDRDSLLDIIIDSGLLGLSRQKFASNVVEKLLRYGNSRQRRAIVREMLKKGDDPTVNSHGSIPGDQGTSVVLLMVRDAYANYVVQTTLDVVPESEEKGLFLQELNSYADELRQYTFAKHIVAKLQTM